jgi:hypothetical protein
VIRYHFDLYPRDDPRDGARVVRFTKLQAAEYRGEANGTGAGRLSIRADVAEAQLIDPRGLQYVRVVREDTVAVTEAVVGGFWLETGDFTLLDEQGTRLLSFGGAGTLAYLSRAVMWSHTYISPIFPGQDPFDDVWRLYAQSTVYANGNLLGAMLWRVLYEAQHNTPGVHKHGDTPPGSTVSDTHDDDRPSIAIADMVFDFDQFEDSNGNDWTLSSGEFKAQVGENVLAVVKRLMEAGLYVSMDPDTFELKAYQAATHRRTRTGTTWGASVIYFTRPTGEAIETANIKSDAKRAIHAYIKRSVVLAGGNNVFGMDTGTSDIPWEGFYYADVNDEDAAENIASVQLGARDDAGDTLRLRGRLGTDTSNGYYRPFEDTLLDDLVTVHTGTDQFDLDDQNFPIAAITINLRPGGDWDVWYDLGSSYTANPSRQFQVQPVPAHNHLMNLCIPGIFASSFTQRLYFSEAGSAITPVTPDASWGGAPLSAVNQLKTAPDDTYGSAQVDIFTGTDIAASNRKTEIDSFAYQITDASLLAAIQAGGMDFRMQARARSRVGIGIDDASQTHYPQRVIRIWRASGGGSVVGTALAADASNTGPRFPRETTLDNRAWLGTLAAVPGAALNDYILLEAGVKHVGPTSGGTGAYFALNSISGDDDLPSTEAGVNDTNLNAWVQFSTGVASLLSDVNDGHPDLIGTSSRAKRCDDTEHFFSERAPTAADDFATAGMRYGTHWVHVDSVDDPTESFGSWMLIDASEGAAVWLQISSGTAVGSHTHPVEDITGLDPTTSVVVEHGTMGAAETFDFTDGTDHEGTLDENLTVTLAGATDGDAAWMTLKLHQDGTGTNTLTLPASVVNGDDVEAAFDTTANAVNVITIFTYDGGTTWYAYLAGGSGGGASALDDLTDVTITAPAEDDHLQYIGGVWVNNDRYRAIVTDGFDTLVWEGDDLVWEWSS